jgi:hypothetical protein
MPGKTYLLCAANAASNRDALKDITSTGEIRDFTGAGFGKNDQAKLHVHETTNVGKVAAIVGVIALLGQKSLTIRSVRTCR